jgi:chitinase
MHSYADASATDHVNCGSILSFLLHTGAADVAASWTQLSSSQRSSIISSYHGAGITLMVSSFGATDVPTGADPTSTANTHAAWVKQWGMDGIDVDYEVCNSFG